MRLTAEQIRNLRYFIYTELVFNTLITCKTEALLDYFDVLLILFIENNPREVHFKHLRRRAERETYIINLDRGLA